VGLIEAPARAQGKDAQTSTLSLDQVPRALAALGFTKDVTKLSCCAGVQDV
jgi:hypothetical protein